MDTQKEQPKLIDVTEMMEGVETFIQHYKKLEYVIDSKGTSIRYSDYKQGYKEDVGSLSELLAQSISEYEINKYIPSDRVKFAFKCVRWINRAISSGIVKPGEGLVNELNQCLERNTKLENDLQKLSVDLLTLQGKYDELKRMTEGVNLGVDYS